MHRYDNVKRSEAKPLANATTVLASVPLWLFWKGRARNLENNRTSRGPSSVIKRSAFVLSPTSRTSYRASFIQSVPVDSIVYTPTPMINSLSNAFLCIFPDLAHYNPFKITFTLTSCIHAIRVTQLSKSPVSPVFFPSYVCHHPFVISQDLTTGNKLSSYAPIYVRHFPCCKLEL